MTNLQFGGTRYIDTNVKGHSDCLEDTNGNGKWNVGEKMTYGKKV